ncbi:MAG: ABC transporter ATP-binding protein [Spirochaetales bacterium]|nr:ABC transporter ATP-binding protein [Candidatus Physcosoma equi]
MNAEILKLENIHKSYATGGKEGSLLVLEDINLTLHGGEVISITGKSGCGKSTLLSVAALLLSKDGGKIYYSGVDTDTLKPKDFPQLRNEKMGFIFQNSLLLEDFSALENVAMPLLVRGMKKMEAYEKATAMLDSVEMLDRLSHRPSTLSGGERQRVAIARALVTEPSIIFADEPTGSLDEKTSAIMEDLLLHTVRGEDRGVVLITHNASFAERCDTMYTLKGGVLQR